MRLFSVIKSSKGVTLVELLVTSAVTLIVVGGVFFFVSYSGAGMKQIATLQQLEQESALISELFMRTVRNGTIICVESGMSAPNENTFNVSAITIRDKSNNAIASFGIKGDSLTMNASKYLTSFLCRFKIPASNFTVYQNGKNADFYLSMYKIAGQDTAYYTQVIGGVRCKN
jgi:hypothetical protein